ncbi:MAG TPA: HIT family protein [Bacteroidales bacterium]
MATIFSKIIQGEIPSYKVAESKDFYAFLDINPLAKGHTLLVPKKEVDYIFDLDENTYKELFGFAKKVAKAIDKSIPCKRVGVIVFGLDVPHAHIHLIPINQSSDMNFNSPKLKLSSDEMAEIAKKINKSFVEN